MESDITKMCLDLKELLEDICTFLTSEKLGKLSAKDQKLAESLINRSKKQLQEISKVQPPPPNEDYVIMNNQVTETEKESEQEQSDIYSSVEDISPVSQPEISLDPYKDLPAKDANDNVKSGWLFMKKRFLLGFEKMKRVYGTIHNHWLLIYLSEKDLKPLCTINLENFAAKDYDDKKSKFELSSKKPNDKKVYHFIALTYKDMLQWTTQINLHHNREKNMEHPESERKYSNTNENVALNNDDDDSDGIYEELTTVHKPLVARAVNDSSNLRFNTYPKLNPCLRSSSTKVKTLVKVPPPIVKSTSASTNNSSESLVSYHEIFTEPINTKSNSNSTKSFEDSFSDNSEDLQYETFVRAKQNITAKNKFKRESSKKTIILPPALPVKRK